MREVVEAGLVDSNLGFDTMQELNAGFDTIEGVRKN